MRQRAMTLDQITEAKKLKEEGYSKRRLADMFGVGGTTLWQHVFSNKERKKYIRIHIRTEAERCQKCDILMTRQIDIKRRFVPINYQVQHLCLECYLREKGVHYRDVMALLDIYGR